MKIYVHISHIKYLLPSIVGYRCMTKTIKWTLYEEFRIVNEDELMKSDMYIIDDGYLLHIVRWNKSTCRTYMFAYCM